jgi:3-deoxy-7-phosphoheptulonate synthase
MTNPAYARYELLAGEIDRAIRFMAAAGADFDSLRTVEFFSSHEALLLEYERALTRIDSRTGLPYDCSAHFLWIGERTRDPEGAHVDFLSRVHNPIGIKLGPTTTAEQAIALADRINPDGIPGRLTFITRMGAGLVREVLPPLVAKVTAEAGPVTWVCDPMHGNTFASPSGYKTRDFGVVLDEVKGFFEVHRELGTVAGGLHVELTGDDVTEVMGGSAEIDDVGLSLRYETLVDPRLNHQQSLEMAFQVAEMIRER